MSLQGVFLVGLGGALGAASRYGVARGLADARPAAPTLLVNVIGSFLFGLLVFGGVESPALLVLGVGYCGALTTFASFSVDVVRLGEDSWQVAAGYAGGTLLACLAAVGLAWLAVLPFG